MARKPTPQKYDKTLDLGEALTTEMKEVASVTGVPSTALIRMCLKAGLNQIRRENYRILRPDEAYGDELSKAVRAELSRVEPSENPAPVTLAVVERPVEPHGNATKLASIQAILDSQTVPARPMTARYWEYETLAAGTISGMKTGGSGIEIIVPVTFEKPVHFVLKVFGDSMAPFVTDGNLAAFEDRHDWVLGAVAAAEVDGMTVIKMMHEVEGRRVLRSLHPDKKRFPDIPIPTDERVIWGHYTGLFPTPVVPAQHV